MGRLRHILTLIFAVAAMLTWYGCNTSGCLENRSSIPLARFYMSSTGDAISIDSLIITGVGKAGNKPLYDGNTPIKEAYLPMRSTENNTAWSIACKLHYVVDDSIHIYYTVADTLAFEYTSSPYFASDECGVIFRYQIEKMTYTKHLIDSVALIDSLVTNTDVERIKIFFRTE